MLILCFLLLLDIKSEKEKTFTVWVTVLRMLYEKSEHKAHENPGFKVLRYENPGFKVLRYDHILDQDLLERNNSKKKIVGNYL